MVLLKCGSEEKAIVQTLRKCMQTLNVMEKERVLIQIIIIDENALNTFIFIAATFSSVLYWPHCYKNYTD